METKGFNLLSYRKFTREGFNSTLEGLLLIVSTFVFRTTWPTGCPTILWLALASFVILLRTFASTRTTAPSTWINRSRFCPATVWPASSTGGWTRTGQSNQSNQGIVVFQPPLYIIATQGSSILVCYSKILDA